MGPPPTPDSDNSGQSRYKQKNKQSCRAIVSCRKGMPLQNCQLPCLSLAVTSHLRARLQIKSTLTPYYPASATVTQTFCLWLTQSFFFLTSHSQKLFVFVLLPSLYSYFDRHTLLGIEIKLLFNIPLPRWLCTLRYRPFRHAMILTFFLARLKEPWKKYKPFKVSFVFNQPQMILWLTLLGS